MAITEQDRIKLYHHFEEQMGQELATKMMDSLPPAGWGDIATKQDIEALRLATKEEFEHTRTVFKLEIETVTHRLGATMERALHLQTGAIAALVITLGAIVNLF